MEQEKESLTIERAKRVLERAERRLDYHLRIGDALEDEARDLYYTNIDSPEGKKWGQLKTKAWRHFVIAGELSGIIRR